MRKGERELTKEIMHEFALWCGWELAFINGESADRESYNAFIARNGAPSQDYVDSLSTERNSALQTIEKIDGFDSPTATSQLIVYELIHQYVWNREPLYGHTLQEWDVMQGWLFRQLTKHAVLLKRRNSANIERMRYAGK